MRWKAFLAVIGVFLVGLMSGVVLGRYDLGPYRAKGTADRRHMDRLSEELNLSEDQRDRIAPGLSEMQRDLFGVRLESLERVDQVIERFENRIRPFLKPEQLERLEELMQRYDDKRQRRRERILQRMSPLSSR